MSGITTHILDTARGRPAAGVAVSLDYETASGVWAPIGKGVTNDDGRAGDLTGGAGAKAGAHRLRFEVGAYYKSQGVGAFYPRIEVIFSVRDPSEHHHVPLLINPFGYTTYRGS